MLGGLIGTLKLIVGGSLTSKTVLTAGTLTGLANYGEELAMQLGLVASGAEVATWAGVAIACVRLVAKKLEKDRAKSE